MYTEIKQYAWSKYNQQIEPCIPTQTQSTLLCIESTSHVEFDSNIGLKYLLSVNYKKTHE